MRRIAGWEDHKAGLQVINAGLGPAIVTNTVVRLDGEEIGHWHHHTQLRVAESMPVKPKVYSLRPGAVVVAGQTTFLLHLEEFSEDEHGWFWDLVTRRLVIEIHYDSLYGGENFRTTTPPFWP